MDASGALHSLAGRSGVLDEVARLAATSGIFLAVLIALGLWLRPTGLRALVALGGGALLALGAAQILGGLWVEARPFVNGHYQPLIGHASDASFPSDHLCVLGAVAGATWMGWRRMAWAAVALAAVVAAARVVAGIHYTGDVVAGFALGVTGAVSMWCVLPLINPLLTRIDALLQHLHLRPATGTVAPSGDG